jgi:hypothetical protein
MTTDKWLATKNFINLWLTDQTVYCNNCGMNFDANYLKYESCCENPQFGRNFDHMYGLYKQNKERRKDLKDNYGSTSKDKHMRVCISLPPRLLEDLERFFKQHGEKFLNDYDELMEFTKRFPQFRVPEKS